MWYVPDQGRDRNDDDLHQAEAIAMLAVNMPLDRCFSHLVIPLHHGKNRRHQILDARDCMNRALDAATAMPDDEPFSYRAILHASLMIADYFDRAGLEPINPTVAPQVAVVPWD